MPAASDCKRQHFKLLAANLKTDTLIVKICYMVEFSSIFLIEKVSPSQIP